MSDAHPNGAAESPPNAAPSAAPRTGILGWFSHRSLMWWLWGSLIVSTVHLLEEILFFDRLALHHIYFGFDSPERWAAFVAATGRQTIFHLVFIGVAAWSGGHWRRYITQFFIIILGTASGVLFIVEAIVNRGYVAGVATGVVLCTPFFALAVVDLLRQGELSWRGLVAWLIATPGAALAVIYGWLI